MCNLSVAFVSVWHTSPGETAADLTELISPTEKFPGDSFFESGELVWSLSSARLSSVTFAKGVVAEHDLFALLLLRSLVKFKK